MKLGSSRSWRRIELRQVSKTNLSSRSLRRSTPRRGCRWSFGIRSSLSAAWWCRPARNSIATFSTWSLYPIFSFLLLQSVHLSRSWRRNLIVTPASGRAYFLYLSINWQSYESPASTTSVTWFVRYTSTRRTIILLIVAIVRSYRERGEMTAAARPSAPKRAVDTLSRLALHRAPRRRSTRRDVARWTLPIPDPLLRNKTRVYLSITRWKNYRISMEISFTFEYFRWFRYQIII